MLGDQGADRPPVRLTAHSLQSAQLFVPERHVLPDWNHRIAEDPAFRAAQIYSDHSELSLHCQKKLPERNFRNLHQQGH